MKHQEISHKNPDFGFSWQFGNPTTWVHVFTLWQGFPLDRARSLHFSTVPTVPLFQPWSLRSEPFVINLTILVFIFFKQWIKEESKIFLLPMFLLHIWPTSPTYIRPCGCLGSPVLHKSSELWWELGGMIAKGRSRGKRLGRQKEELSTQPLLLKRKKLRHREVKQFALSYTAWGWRSWNLNPLWY